MRRAEEIEAEGHELLAKGHARLAEAARLRRCAPAPAPTSEWIPVADSPLGRRRTLALARAGTIESSKVGRKVLVRRASLEALINEGQRGAHDDDEDLFGKPRRAG